MIQYFVDGILVGFFLLFGVIGLIMVMYILCFVNFLYVEFLLIGVYCVLVFDKVFESLLLVLVEKIGLFFMIGVFVILIVLLMVIIGFSVIVIDKFVFQWVWQKGEEFFMVFVFFGMVFIICNLIGLIFGLLVEFYFKDIVFVMVLLCDFFFLVKLDQVFVLIVVLVLMVLLYFVLLCIIFGFLLWVVVENLNLVQVYGVNLKCMIVVVWIIGGGFGVVVGIFYGLSYQIMLVMGCDFVLLIFVVIIVGGIGSVYGVVFGGFIVGIVFNFVFVILLFGYSLFVLFLMIFVVFFVCLYGFFGEVWV